MKSVSLLLGVLLLGQLASAAEGTVDLNMNDDETVLVIRGAAAEEMYRRLAVKAVPKDQYNHIKVGKNIVCLSNEDEAKCILTLGETEDQRLNGKCE